MKKILAIALIISVLSIGCKKEVTDVELLTGGTTNSSKTWTISGATVDPPYPISGTTVTNYFTQLPQCQQDDQLQFGADGTYLDRDWGVRCGGPQLNAMGKWSFGTNKTLVVGAKTYGIVELTAENLAFTQTFVDKGVTFTVTWRYNLK